MVLANLEAVFFSYLVVLDFENWKMVGCVSACIVEEAD